MKGRARVFLISGLSGALVGLIGAWLYLRSVQSSRRSDRPLPEPAELIRLGLSIVGILRQIVGPGLAGDRVGPERG